MTIFAAMMIPPLLILLISWAGVASTQPTGVSSSVPQSTACGDIIRRTNSSDSDHYTLRFDAPDVFACLSTVPFNPAVASRFVKYFNDTIQFHSTLAYLRNPPNGYQQPAVDLVKDLGVIQHRIDEGYYRNEYHFEEAVQRLIYSAHDKHLRLNAGVLSAFRFVSPWSVVSLSSDGQQEPRLYLRDDVRASRNATHPWQPSPIQNINGEDPERFFTLFAQIHSPGNLDPHADWNSLMYNLAQTVQLETELFRDLVLYPGDTISVVLENGTELGPEPFHALYVDPGPTGPLETGGDFYNFFVLGWYPAGFYRTVIKPFLDSYGTQENEKTATSSATPTQPNTNPTVSSTPLNVDWTLLNPEYPKPNLLQANIGQSDGSLISGYFLEGTDLAVIRIPSFKTSGYGAKAFGDAISQFISKSLKAEKKKILIDLQRNGGGSPTLAVDAFKRFFPDIDPFMGTRMRAHDMANDLGRVTDEFWTKKADMHGSKATAWEYSLSSSEWVASNRIDAETNKTFASWQDFYGPNELHGDSFTKTQRYNYSDAIYVTDSLWQPESLYIVYGYEGNPPKRKAAFEADSITILTDGLCDSACALFVEMMRYEARVKAVVAGGRPAAGPMQATGGTRGARGYSLSVLDIDIYRAQHKYASDLDKEEEVTSLPERINDIFTFSGGVNTRDAVRKGQEIPLQFLYDPADCRIFYTQETLFNQTALWIYAGQALQSPDSHCVANSTGQNRFNPPELTHPPPISNHPNEHLYHKLKDSLIALGDAGVESQEKQVFNAKITGTLCSNDDDCVAPDLAITNSFRCVSVDSVYTECSKKICVPKCYRDSYCDDIGVLTGACRRDLHDRWDEKTAKYDLDDATRPWWGHCVPHSSLCGASDETLSKKRSTST